MIAGRPMQPSDVIVVFLGIMVGAPFVAAIFAFMPDARVRQVARPRR